LPAKQESFPDTLRRTIRESGLSYAALARLADIDPRQASRFVEGFDLTFEAASRIGQALGLELKEPVKPRGRPKKPGRSPSGD
jgi:plasmid maintenance system antidote protein VapI